MTFKDLIKILIVAAITIITLTLPGYLYLRGLPLPWALALAGGYAIVAILGHLFDK